MLPSYPSYIRRMSTPNTYDHAPQGTLCITHDGQIYKQISKNQEMPEWDNITNSISKDELLIIKNYKDTQPI